MKLNIMGDKEPQLYLVRLQSKIPKFFNCTDRKGKRRTVLMLKKGVTVRVMATSDKEAQPSDKEAQQKALFRKRNSLARRNVYLVRWSRPFYA
jgi:hypothetical protein